MSGLMQQESQPALSWKAHLYSYDHIPVPDEYKAAHQIFLRYLPLDAKPHWLLASSSDGRNAFGKEVARASFHVGWVSVREFCQRQAQQFEAAFARLNALPRAYAETVAEQSRRDRERMLVSSAHMPLIARSVHLVNPQLRFQDLLYGVDMDAALQAFLHLNEHPGRLQALHAAVLEPRAVVQMEQSGFEPLPQRQPAAGLRFEGIRIDTCVAERPFCDAVFTITFPQMTPRFFATMAQILRTRTAEFRSRLWRRGGIYGAGLEVSLSQRTFSWWTNLDHAPLETCRILRDIILEAEDFTLLRHEPERALAFFPTPAPRLAGAVLACQDGLWGITQEDRDALVGAALEPPPPGFWANLLQGAVFSVCGPPDNIARIHREIDAHNATSTTFATSVTSGIERKDTQP